MVEVVHHVPAQLLELLPLLQEAVEEAEGEEELPVGPGLGAAAELSFGNQLEEPRHVSFHALQTAADWKEVNREALLFLCFTPSAIRASNLRPPPLF